jgi:ureidoglycolate hydrolase
MWRVYHKPNAEKVMEQFGTSPGVQAAAKGYTRVGLMRLGPKSVGLYGNIALPAEDASVDPVIQTSAFMAALMESPTADELGKLTAEMLLKYGHTAYWARKQQTDTCYSALDNRVLFIGDSAGGIYPSLGQGANLSLEDAVVAAAAFPDVSQIAALRHDRREFIKSLSKYHARHLCEDAGQFETEMIQWRGEDTNKEWHGQLRRLWSPRLALRAVTATQDNWAPFGQLIGEAVDGVVFDAKTTDADLDLSQGTPRLYYMKLEGGRPLRVSEITRHKAVTQCLGALSTTEDFYLVVHRPDMPLSLTGLQAFRIPPRHYVKLHRGTWHVGPLWTGPDLDRTFVNLELADTNVVDHDTVTFRTLSDGTNGSVSSNNDKTKEIPLIIPVMPVVL